jgi:RNA polymerase sigma factor (sigma-70 family)
MVQVRTNEEWRDGLRATGAGQEAALTDLRACVYRAARFYVQRHADELGHLPQEEIAAIADDAAQEATLEVLAKLDHFRGDASFPTWASKFGVTACAQMLRRRQWRDLSLEDLPAGWEEHLAGMVDPAGQPELMAQRREVMRVLLQVAREELTGRQRDLLGYVLFHGIPPDEVAERLGISRGACYKLGHDARRAVKRAFERRGWICDEVLAAFAGQG